MFLRLKVIPSDGPKKGKANNEMHFHFSYPICKLGESSAKEPFMQAEAQENLIAFRS